MRRVIWVKKPALLAPDLEDAWLVLTAADSNPEDALAYAQKALELNPASVRARKGVEWAMAKLKQAQLSPEPSLSLGTQNVSASRTASIYDDAPAVASVKRETKKSPPPAESKPGNKRNLIVIGVLLGLLVCIAIAIAAWWAFNNLSFSSVFPVKNNMPEQQAYHQQQPGPPGPHLQLLPLLLHHSARTHTAQQPQRLRRQHVECPGRA